MAQNAYFRVSHSSYNRGEWGYGRVAAAARYAANQNKRGLVATVGLPLFENSYDAQRAILSLEKEATRKNARLGESLIISFPNGLPEQHRKLLMERFLWRVTFGGKTYAQAWEHTDKAHNPHFHAVIIDRDRETGKSLGKFGHSRSYRAKAGMEPNVTEWFRMQWEATGNELFAEFGYDLEFDRRSNLARGLDAPGQHRGVENDNSPTPLEEETMEAAEVTNDADVALVRGPDENVSLAANDIRLLFETRTDLGYLREARNKVAEARAYHQSLLQKRDQAQFERNIYAESTTQIIYEAEQAESTLERYVDHDGRLKGRSLTIPPFKVFGLEFKGKRFATKTRLEAEEAASEVERLRPAAEIIKDKLKGRDEAVAGYEKQAIEAEISAYMRQKELERLYCGTEITEEECDRTLDAAEQAYRATINRAARGVPLEAAREAFLAVEITEDEYEAFLIEGGYDEELEHLNANRELYEIVEVPDEEEEEGL